MKSDGHAPNTFPVGGFLRTLPFWLGAVIVSFVPTIFLSHPCLLPLDVRFFYAGDISGWKTSVSTETLHGGSDPRPEAVWHCLDEAGKRLRHLPDNSNVPPTHHHKRGSSRWGNCWTGKLSRERPDHPRRTHTSWGYSLLNSPTWHPSPAPRGSTSGAQLDYTSLYHSCPTPERSHDPFRPVRERERERRLGQ